MFAMTVAFSIQQLFNNVIPENFPMIFPQLYLLREIFPTNGNIFYNDTRSTRIFFSHLYVEYDVFLYTVCIRL